MERFVERNRLISAVTGKARSWTESVATRLPPPKTHLLGGSFRANVSERGNPLDTRRKVVVFNRIATASAMPRNDGKGMEPNEEPPPLNLIS